MVEHTRADVPSDSDEPGPETCERARVPVRVNVAIAPGIRDDSWLHRGDDDFERFKVGYGYASAKTMAIGPLSKLTPEEAYWLWSLVNLGIDYHMADQTPAGKAQAAIEALLDATAGAQDSSGQALATARTQALAALAALRDR